MSVRTLARLTDDRVIKRPTVASDSPSLRIGEDLVSFVTMSLEAPTGDE